MQVFKPENQESGLIPASPPVCTPSPGSMTCLVVEESILCSLSLSLFITEVLVQATVLSQWTTTIVHSWSFYFLCSTLFSTLCS